MRMLVLLLAVFLGQSCRTSRQTVEIQDPKDPGPPSSEDYLNVGRSVQTTFAISAVSVPAQGRIYEYLDLGLRRAGEPTEVYSRKKYQPGEKLPIEPHLDYEIVVTAMRGSTEIYSTRYCEQRQRFRAEKGPNVFTASLCAKPDAP